MNKSAAKKLAYKAFQVYMRSLWTQTGVCKCYTCDRTLTFKTCQTGHWVTGHANSTYINEAYVRPQDSYCNIMLGGNQGIFRDRIRQEIGDKKTDELLLASKLKVEISVEEYLQLETYYKQKLAELKQDC